MIREFAIADAYAQAFEFIKEPDCLVFLEQKIE